MPDIFEKVRASEMTLQGRENVFFLSYSSVNMVEEKCGNDRTMEGKRSWARVRLYFSTG